MSSLSSLFSSSSSSSLSISSSSLSSSLSLLGLSLSLIAGAGMTQASHVRDTANAVAGIVARQDMDQGSSLNTFLKMFVVLLVIAVFACFTFLCFRRHMHNRPMYFRGDAPSHNFAAAGPHETTAPPSQAYAYPPAVYTTSSTAMPAPPPAPLPPPQQGNADMTVSPSPLGYPAALSSSSSSQPTNADRAQRINRAMDVLPAFTAGSSTRDNVCSLCFETFDHSLVTMGASCMHMVHHSCLTAWLPKAPDLVCPICRQPLIPAID